MATPAQAISLGTAARFFLWLRHFSEQRAAKRDVDHQLAAHLRTGERGEDLAWLYLRSLGYTVVARRWCSPRLRGDLDLLAWDGDTLVIFEVKTRTARDFAPAETAVDRNKQRIVSRLASAYLRQLPEPWRERVQLRGDVVCVYDLPSGTSVEHLRNAFPLASH